ncbi:hypothetical protein [Streptomyces venezuelae]|uniref:hypothetical protein n=1 Tax=Streptomyces venezuelae TaxID=54571 RepID=UPI00123990D2|nr:hypothetical protein [Streptomyces venezuelae]
MAEGTRLLDLEPTERGFRAAHPHDVVNVLMVAHDRRRIRVIDPLLEERDGILKNGRRRPAHDVAAEQRLSECLPTELDWVMSEPSV